MRMPNRLTDLYLTSWLTLKYIVTHHNLLSNQSIVIQIPRNKSHNCSLYIPINKQKHLNNQLHVDMFCNILLSPSVWADQRGCQGDKLVINQLITIISPCPETLQLCIWCSNYTCFTPIYNLYMCKYKGLQAFICLCGRCISPEWVWYSWGEAEVKC